MRSRRYRSSSWNKSRNCWLAVIQNPFWIHLMKRRLFNMAKNSMKVLGALTIAAVLTVMVCVNYLKLQSACTALQKEGTRMESSLNMLRLENDREYNRIMSSVNLEEIKETAIEKLGMVYIKADQIETYDASGSDYVRQYMEVPDR